MKHYIIYFLIFFNFCVFCIAPPKNPDNNNLYNSLKKTIKSSRTISKANYSSLRSINKAPIPNFNWQGDINLIVILFDFLDQKFERANTKEYVRTHIFDRNIDNSVASFYYKSSFGKVNINEVAISNIITLDQNYKSYYSDGEYPGIMRTALTKAFEEDSAFRDTVNNATYIDKNSNGFIQGPEQSDISKFDNTFLIFIHAGQSAENNGVGIYSHQWELNYESGFRPLNSEGTGYNSDYTFYTYLTVGDLNTVNGSPVSILCHELGHHLGASDFYDDGGTLYKGTGRWSLMDGGVWAGYYNRINVNDEGQFYNNVFIGADFDAYHKTVFGWVNPIDMKTLGKGTNNISLKPLSDISSNINNMVYKYLLNDDGTEYYLFSNRADAGLDRIIFNFVDQNGNYVKQYTNDYGNTITKFNGLNNGMMVLHMDENVRLEAGEVYLNNFINNHTSSSHPAAWLVRADNRAESPDDINDLYPSYSNNSFTPFSTPNSYAYNSFNSPVIKNIVRNGNNIDFDFVNNISFLISYAQNIFDNKKIHIYTKPNFSVEGGIKGTLKSESNEYNIDFHPVFYNDGTVQKVSLYKSEWDFVQSIPGTFEIILKHLDSSDNVIETGEVLLTDQETSKGNFIIGKEIDFYDIKFSSDKNIFYYNSSKSSDNGLEKIKTFYLINSSDVNVNNNSSNKKTGVYEYKDDKWTIIREHIFSGQNAIGIFNDVEDPYIEVVNNRDFNIIDKYSGIKDVNFMDNNGSLKYYKNGDNFYLKRAPEGNLNINVRDNALNSISKTIKMVSPKFIKSHFYPNPANAFVQFDTVLDTASDKILVVYDTSGKKVYKDIIRSFEDQYIWDLRDRRGKYVSNGVYFFEIKAGSSSYKGKIVVLR